MRLHTIRVFAFACLPALAQTPAEPLSLERALEIAAKANPEVQLARLQMAEREAQAAQASSAWRPQLNGLLQTTYQTSNLQGIGLTFPGVPDRIGPYSTFNARPQLSQTVLDLQLLAQTRAAGGRVRQAEEDALLAREHVLASVIQFYLRALQASSRLRAAEARVRSFDAVRQQVADRVEAGSANKLDLARAVEQVERERTASAYAKRDRDILTTLLIRALGLTATGPAELLPLPTRAAMPSDRHEALSTALRDRPEMRVLNARRSVLELEARAASRQRLPKFGITADAGAFGSTIPASVSTYLVAGTVTIPIYTGGRIENEMKAARIRLEQWEQERRQAEVAIAQEVAQSFVEADGAEAAHTSAEKAAAAARDAVELSRLRYEAGLATNLDVVTAQSALTEAEEEEIRARFDGLLALARLAAARGNARGFLASR